MESYEKGGFLLSALVVGKLESEPSIIFFQWMRELGVLPNLKQDTRDEFWVDQVSKAHAWYQSHPPAELVSHVKPAKRQDADPRKR